MTFNRLHFLASAIKGLYIVAEFGSELLLVSHLNWISKSRWSIGNQEHSDDERKVSNTRMRILVSDFVNKHITCPAAAASNFNHCHA